MLSRTVAFRVDESQLEERLSPERLSSGHGRSVVIRRMLEEQPDLTVRTLLRRLSGARGHFAFAGTAVQVADKMEEWFSNGAADGFNLMFPTLPSSLALFVQQVVPELQRRGLFRTEYEGATLRDHLGLSRPINRYACIGVAQPSEI